LGWAIGLPLAVWLNTVVFEAIARGGSEVNEWLLSALSGFIIGAVVGLVSGLIQWLALSLYGLRAGAWAFVSAIGWALGFAIASPLSTWLVQQVFSNQGLDTSTLLLNLIIAASFGLLGGLMSGVFQMPALGDQARRGGMWVLASLAIWTLTFCGIALFLALLNNPGASVFSWAGNEPLSHVITGATLGAVGGVMSGAAMAGVV
jgi:hypothetical protein